MDVIFPKPFVLSTDILPLCAPLVQLQDANKGDGIVF
jgi:hypothetical protein